MFRALDVSAKETRPSIRDVDPEDAIISVQKGRPAQDVAGVSTSWAFRSEAAVEALALDQLAPRLLIFLYVSGNSPPHRFQ